MPLKGLSGAVYKINRMLALALTYVGAIVGAGFASGQELLQFFVSFGPAGLWGTVVAGIGFMILGVLIFQLAAANNITSYHELLLLLLGKKIGRLADFWLSLYLFAGLVIMLAGCGAVFKEYFSLPAWMGVLTSTLVLLCALLAHREGVLAFNSVLVPGMIVGMLVVAVLTWEGPNALSFNENIHRNTAWLLSALLYVSYNMISGLVILVSYTGSHHREGTGAALWGGFILGALAWILCGVLLQNYHVIDRLEVPLLYLARREYWLLGIGYAVVLWLAMVTTAMVNGVALAFRLAGKMFSYPTVVMMLLVTAGSLSNLGFSLLIKTLYPFFGYLNLVVLAAVLIKSSRTTF